VQRVRDLGLRYGILTEYTSYLVQEPGVIAGGPVPPTAPMPVAQRAREATGAGAFGAAKSSSDLSQSRTVQAANDAAALRLEELVVAGTAEGKNERRDVKRVGGKLFAKDKGVWTDLAHRDTLKVTTIAPFSRAWFDLAAARPMLKSALSAGSPLLLAGTRASLKIAEDGLTEWAPGQMARFLLEFEGR